MTNILHELAREVAKTDLPRLNPGDSVKVFVRIKEGAKERTQAFEGVIIKKRSRPDNHSKKSFPRCWSRKSFPC